MARAVSRKTAPRPARRPFRARVRRRQVDRSEATRAALIRAAIDTVSQRGFAGTTAAGIAARARVTRGALQHHFGTMQDLYLAVVRYVSQELVGEIEAEISAHDPLDQRIGAIVDRYWRVYGGADYFALVEIWMGSRNNNAFRAQVEDLMKQITEQRNEHWRGLLAEFPLSDVELDTMRGALLAVIRGAAIHRTFWKDDERALRQISFVFALAKGWIEEKAMRIS